MPVSGQPAFALMPAARAALRDSLSGERLDHYLAPANGCPDLAFLFLLWDVRLAESLYHPLQTAEVVLRNRLARTLTQEFGPQWWEHPSLTGQISKAEAQELADSAAEAQATHGHAMTAGHVVARMTFGFWHNLLSLKHRKHFFLQHPLAGAFPRLRRRIVERLFTSKRIVSKSPVSPNRPHHFRPYAARAKVPASQLINVNEMVREDLWGMAGEIRAMRNRIAHHRPIFDKGPMRAYQVAVALADGTCADASWFLISFSSFEEVLARRPA